MRSRHSWSAMLVIAILIAVCGCGEAGDAPHDDAVAPAAEEVLDGRVSTADGLAIAYDARGAGEPALVFVHCWSCDREFWKEQVEVFAGSHRVVALDLGGHGDSDATRDDWTILGLAGDVVAVADTLGLERMILIGHSLGGPVALEAARRMPGRVLGVIAADTLHDAELDFDPEQMERMIAPLREDFAGAMAGMFAALAGDMDPALRDWIVERAAAADPEVALGLFDDFPALDLPTMFAEAAVPIRAINAAPNEMTPVTAIETNRKYADFDAVILDGVGHFLQLERPEEFNRALRRYVDELGASASP